MVDPKIYKEVVYKIIGAAMRVHNELNWGLLEALYTEALHIELFNYMRLTRTPIGLLINFGQPSLEGERYMLIEETNECVLLDRDMNPVYDNPNNDYYSLSKPAE